MSDKSEKWSRIQLACTIFMVGVWVVFAVCEWLFFRWGDVPGYSTDATYYAHLGLWFASLFLVMRWLQIFKAHIEKNLLFFWIVGCLLFPPRVFVDFAETENGKNHYCMRSLSQLGEFLAFTPENDRRSAPRVFYLDKDGKPRNGWRMQFVREKGGYSIAKGYDSRKPWDDPQNVAIASKIENPHFLCPNVYRLPGQLRCRTDYVAVTGDDTMWPTNRRRREWEVKAGLENTAMLIEIKDSDIPWYEPRDVSLDDFISGKLSWTKTAPHPIRRRTEFLDPHSLFPVFEEFEWGRHILMADGSVRYTRGDMTPDQIRRLFSVTEPFDVEKELPRWSEPRPIPFRYAVFNVWVGSLVLMFVYVYVPVMGNRFIWARKRNEDEKPQRESSYSCRSSIQSVVLFLACLIVTTFFEIEGHGTLLSLTKVHNSLFGIFYNTIITTAIILIAGYVLRFIFREVKKGARRIFHREGTEDTEQ